MEFTIRKINTKIFTGIPSEVEEQVNHFLRTLEMLNYVDIKVANSNNGTITVVVVYKVVQTLKHV
jgi:hypothetical protein